MTAPRVILTPDDGEKLDEHAINADDAALTDFLGVEADPDNPGQQRSVYKALPASLGHGVQVTFDNGADALTEGGKVRGRVRFAGTVTKWSIVGLGGPGSCTVGVKSSTYAGFPGSLADLTSGVDLAVSAAHKNEATASGIIGATVAAGDVLEFELKTVATFTQVNVLLEY